MNPSPDLLAALDAPPPAARAPRPSRRRWAWGGGAVLLLAVALGTYAWRAGDAEPSWKTAEVTRADLQQTVSATGTLEAVVTVDVGTQVSGTITALLVDYNDEVVAGQLLAQIDPTLLQADVASARATLAQRQAAAMLADQELSRVRFLTEHQASSPQELEIAEASATEAQANVAAARVSLDRAERNLGYATIVSPIEGTVLDRAVDVGQTVNAGMSAPTLYTLAGDLTHMQILATVDEADIGLLSESQPVDFTVQAYPERSFEGSVRQVRLQSTTTDAVVTYTAVVDVDNPERLLLPGMTTSVDFVVASAEDALTVPAAALRFSPPGASDGPSRDGSGRGQRGEVVWTLDEAGALRPVPVTAGLSDGSSTALEGEGLSEGMLVVTGQLTAGAGAGTTAPSSTSPFQNQQERGGPGQGPPPGGM